MLTFPYDRSESPPVPFIELQICPSVTLGLVRPERAKVDSGSGITILPQNLIDQFRLFPFGEVLVIGYDGTASRHLTYQVEILDA